MKDQNNVYNLQDGNQQQGTMKTIQRAQLEAEIHEFPILTAPKSGTMHAHDLYLLHQTGRELVQVVTGNIVYSMGLKGLLRSFRRAFMQGEMIDFTKMIDDARELARNRMLAKAQALGATEVIAVTYETHEYADFIEVVCVGTAVRKVGEVKQIEVSVAA